MKIKKNFLLQEKYYGSLYDLILINLQPSIEHRITYELSELNKFLSENSEHIFDSYYFYNGEEDKNEKSDIVEWFKENFVNYDRFLNESLDIEELSDYFDKVFETNYSDKDILFIYKFLISNNYDSIKNCSITEIDKFKINNDFKDDLKNSKIVLSVPYKLLNVLKELKNPLIIGGLKHNSVKMIVLLLEAINKKYNISDYIF